MTLKLIFNKLIDFSLDLLFPKHCLGCQTEGFLVCDICFEKIEINRFSNCYICNKLTSESRVCYSCQKKTKLNGILIASHWDNQLLRDLIYEYKYRFIKDIANPLSQLLINFLKNSWLYYHPINDIIFVPVPLHPKRFTWRGFNQAELLAKKVGHYFNIQVINLVTRVRNTSPQVEIKTQKQRRKNIKSAFVLNHQYCSLVKNKIVVLVDDIITTGSTLEECAKTIKTLKPKEIWGLVLARG